MITLLSFVWIVGAMFTMGKASEISEFPEAFIPKIACVIYVFVVWPVLLGRIL